MTSGEPQPAGMLGSRLGNYRVVEQLGEGGMGVVYLGRHEALGHRVAIKVLRPEMSRNADMVRRFFNEAQAAAAIRSPGIVQIFDFGTTSDGRAYFVMELLEGGSLAARLNQRRLEYAECCRIGRQAANILLAAHTAAITHRDLKPDNLFLVPDTEVIGGERVKVLDFGIAKLAAEVHTSGVRTRTDVVMGTPSYMSPEQSRGASMVDWRSDIYSLGCILFEMTCGRPPFVGEGAGGIIGAHQYVEPPQPRSLVPDIPGKLSKLILEMLAKQPNARPQSMAAVGQALEEILQTLESAPKRAPKRAPTPLPAADTSPSSTTLAVPVGTSPGDTSKQTRRLLVVLGGLVAGVIAIAIVAGTRGSGSSTPSIADASAAVAVVTADAGVMTEPPPDAPVTVDSPPTPDAEDMAVILPDEETAVAPDAGTAIKSAGSELEVECLHYQAERKWEDLASCADRLMGTNPARAKELQARAILETKAALQISAFETAMREGNLKSAKAELDKIPNTASAYAKIRSRYVQAEAAAIHDVIERLERVKSGDCKEYNQILQEEKASRPPRVSTEAARQVKCTLVKVQTCDHEALAEQGRVQFGRTQFAEALSSYEDAWNCKQDPQYAEKIFIVACNLVNVGKAKLFWKRMSGAMKQRALMICVRNNITQDVLDAP